MPFPRTPALSRRALLQMGGFSAAALTLPRLLPAAPAAIAELTAAPGSVTLVGDPHPDTSVWGYNGGVPGPEIRLRQGERLRVNFTNGLDQETTVHWHGLRVPNAMDGVPHLTQPPIGPGESFLYEFDVPDAGTFWYHPHQRSSEQVGRGLYGPLIVEEAAPIRVDREVTWMLDDWRLTPEAAVAGGFGNGHDASHDGRVGNTVTINGRLPDEFAVRPGERVRLRLINAANARIFGLDFGQLNPVVIALDGQPVTPHEADGPVVVGPAMRVDLVLDMAAAPGGRVRIIDRFYDGMDYRLVDLVHAEEPLRDVPPAWPVELSANPLAEPDLAAAERHEITFNGGMMGQMMMPEAGMAAMMERMREGAMWFVNGIAASGHAPAPALTLARGRTHVIAMANDTGWHHPIHLHGHSFRVISRDGQPTWHREWQDTVLMAPRERVEIAFVADNPGDWMFHCHILEHQAAGMMAVLRVPGEGVPT